ncbi:MAG: HlyD family type I secretion periplasmic adaptor subunit [Burkholderiaceae bacterium]
MKFDFLRLPFGPQGAAAPKPREDAESAEDPKELKAPPVNLGRALTWGWIVLLVGVGGFVAWAGFAPLDQGVTAPGQVVVTGNRKTVQHLNGGIVSKILVKDGDEVKAGQPVVLMDTTASKAQLESARAQWIISRSVESRLIAERDNRAAVAFPADLTAEAKDPEVTQSMALQSRLFESRRASIRNEIAVLNETIAGFEVQISGLQSTKASKEEQIKLLREEIRNQRELAADGYLPRNRVSEQERLLAALTGALSEDLTAIARARASISEYKMRIISRESDFRQQIETQLTDAQKEVNTLSSRINALRFDLANTEVKAPVDGVVVALAVHTPGGIVQGGAPMMDIVPKEEPLRIDANIPTQFIDKIRIDLPVDVLFPAFNQKFTPHIPAVVRTISADTLIDQRSGQPYYRAQVIVTADGMKKLKEHKIKAGMQAEVFIKTGERTAFNYLVKPFRDRIRAAMTEE